MRLGQSIQIVTDIRLVGGDVNEADVAEDGRCRLVCRFQSLMVVQGEVDARVDVGHGDVPVDDVFHSSSAPSLALHAHSVLRPVHGDVLEGDVAHTGTGLAADGDAVTVA